MIEALETAQSNSAELNKPPQSQYGTWTEYKDAASRHVRKERSPRELLPTPLTSSQDYGWTVEGAETFAQEVFARKSCPETTYASHLIKSGIV